MREYLLIYRQIIDFILNHLESSKYQKSDPIVIMQVTLLKLIIPLNDKGQSLK
jgi:hypothetical protein